MDIAQIFSTNNVLYLIGFLLTAIGGLCLRWLGKLQENMEAMSIARSEDLKSFYEFRVYIEQDFAKRVELTERFNEMRSILIRIEDKLYERKQ